jgi:hypothetical protein
VLSIAGILQVLHKTDVEEKYGKGDYCRNAQITQRSVFHRAGNLVSGPEILPQGRNFCPWTKFLGARNLAKSFTKRCGAMLYKGAGNSDLAEFPGAENSIISDPQKFG